MSDEPHYILDEATPFTEHDFLTTLDYFRTREHRSSLYGEWITETEQERRIVEIGKRYSDACDVYDATACSGVGRDGPIPINSNEWSDVNWNAKRVREKLMAEYNITEKELHEAIQQYAKHERR